MFTGKQAANILSKRYSLDSNVAIRKDIQREWDQDYKQSGKSDMPAQMKEPITLAKLQNIFIKLKPRSCIAQIK